MTLEPPLCRTISRNTTQVMLQVIKTLGLSGMEEYLRDKKNKYCKLSKMKKDSMNHCKKTHSQILNIFLIEWNPL